MASSPAIETRGNSVSDAESIRQATPVRKIRVLHIIHSVCHGGIESALINWVKNFDRSQFEVHVACFAGDRGLEAAFLTAAKAAGIAEVLTIPWNRRKPFLGAARATADLVREHRIDVIHTHAYYGDMVGALTKLYAPVKTVATVYVWGKYELHRQIMQALDWVALRFVDKVTAHCDETLRKTLKLGFKKENVPILIAGFPNDVDPPSSQERLRLRREAGVADDEVLMLNIARIHPEKAHDQLLESFKLVHEKHPKTKLWISGVGWKWLEDQLLEQRARLGLADCVSFVGFRQNLWPMLHAADMMVHSSHVEGVPIAILYGMSAGLPIVVSDVGGVYEVIADGENGLRIPENDVAGFAEAVSGLIENPKRGKQLGSAARRFVTTDYSIETACRRVEDLYREVLGA